MPACCPTGVIQRSFGVYLTHLIFPWKRCRSEWRPPRRLPAERVYGLIRANDSGGGFGDIREMAENFCAWRRIRTGKFHQGCLLRSVCRASKRKWRRGYRQPRSTKTAEDPVRASCEKIRPVRLPCSFGGDGGEAMAAGPARLISVTRPGWRGHRSGPPAFPSRFRIRAVDEACR